MKFRAKDIAEELGISTSTVSLAINGKKSVNEETRRRVFDCIREKGFSLDEIIKAPVDTSKSLVLVFYKHNQEIVSQSPFFMEIIEGMEREARNLGYKLFVKYFSEQEDTIDSICSDVLSSLPAGVIVLGTDMEIDYVRVIKALPFPMLVLNNTYDHERINCVAINNREGAYCATKHLIDCGHTVIGHLQSNIEINNFRSRTDGFQQALNEAGLSCKPEHVFRISPTQKGAYEDMKRILEGRPSLPTAFFGDSDRLVISAMRAIKEAGYRVPQDVSLVGFDDSPMSSVCEPELTTVRVSTAQMGAIAVRQMDQMIANPEELQNLLVYVAPSLVLRNSVVTLTAEKKPQS